MQRRKFLQSAAIAAAGLSSIAPTPKAAASNNAPEEKSLYVIGPTEGYSPQIGTLVSMLNYNRSTIINGTKDLTMEQLDFLADAKANTIGGLILHLGATDKWYQINSFEGRNEFNDSEKLWSVAMNLGDEGRKQIKGHDIKYYIDLITEVRVKTLAELKKKDDDWLLAVDPKFGGGGQRKFNTYWKWFHVCEHESNHRGQITWLKRRMPGAKEEGE